MKKIPVMAIAALILAFGALNLFTQDEEAAGEYNGLKTNNGMMLIYNHKDGVSFSLEIKADNMDKVPGDNLILNADGKLIQVLTVPFDAFLPKDSADQPGDIDILARHKAYEAQYLNETLKKDVALKGEELKSPDNRRWLFWQFDTPKEFYDTSSVIIKKQMYATTVVGKDVLMLSSVVSEMDDEAKVYNFLKDIMFSVRTSQKPYDLEKLKDSLKNVKQ